MEKNPKYFANVFHLGEGDYIISENGNLEEFVNKLKDIIVDDVGIWKVEIYKNTEKNKYIPILNFIKSGRRWNKEKEPIKVIFNPFDSGEHMTFYCFLEPKLHFKGKAPYDEDFCGVELNDPYVKN